MTVNVSVPCQCISHLGRHVFRIPKVTSRNIVDKGISVVGGGDIGIRLTMRYTLLTSRTNSVAAQKCKFMGFRRFVGRIQLKGVDTCVHDDDISMIGESSATFFMITTVSSIFQTRITRHVRSAWILCLRSLAERGGCRTLRLDLPTRNKANTRLLTTWLTTMTSILRTIRLQGFEEPNGRSKCATLRHVFKTTS
jgi:hypothetical protein